MENVIRLERCRFCNKTRVTLNRIMLCPICRRLGAARLTPVQARTAWAILINSQRACSTRELVELVWPNPDDEPQFDPENNIRKHVSDIKNKLRDTPYVVRLDDRRMGFKLVRREHGRQESQKDVQPQRTRTHQAAV